ncbi:MAG: sulfate adenylyltransferase subunit CysN, partial [Steroidobacteraceae bacterium]
MSAEPEPLPMQLQAWLAAQANKDLLRFITCGSVDDGKSTLIGRLLYESRVLFEDQLSALERDSRRIGTQGEELDFALLVDGLAAEREQGITIDVAYRFFATERRKYIVADTPGHEQYTRNMVTGASTAELAVILIDARKGVLTQTRRHSYLVSLLGIRRVVLAINKMDLVEYAEPVFRRIEREYREFAARIGLTEITAIPVSALAGDNVIEPGTHMPWYHGPTLLAHLDTVPPVQRAGEQPFRMPVQWVNRPNHEFRGYAGLIVGGGVRVGDALVVQPSGLKSRVARILGPDGELPQAVAGQSITLVLEDEIDISRGDLFASVDAPAQASDLFEATVVWMSEEPMLPGRPYLLKCGTRTVTATVAPLKHKINVNTLEKLAARELELNEIGVAHLNLDRALAFDPYADNRDTGGFILIDRISNNTV